MTDIVWRATVDDEAWKVQVVRLGDYIQNGWDTIAGMIESVNGIMISGWQ